MEHDRTNLLFDLIRRDPVAGALKCRERVRSDEAGFQRDRLMRIAEAALITRELRNNYDAWVRFLSDPYFESDRKLKFQDAQTYIPFVSWAVMQFNFNPDIKNKTKRNRTWKYARAIDFHEIEQLPPEEIADQIERAGGIEQLCRRAAQEDPRHEQQAMLATGPKVATVRGAVDQDEGDETEDADHSQQSTPPLYGIEYDPEPPLSQRTIYLDEYKLRTLEQAAPGDRVQLTVVPERGDKAGEIIFIVESADWL